MAIVGPLVNPKVIIGGTDFSDHVTDVLVNMGKQAVEVTAGSAYGKSYRLGLADESFEFTFRDDYAAASIDAVLAPLYLNGTSVSIEVRPTSAGRSSTNPAYSATACYLADFNGLEGSIGSALDKKVKFVVDGQTNGVQRATS